MHNSNFPFVKNKILRENIDVVFNHILTLITFLGYKEYSREAKSSFRKTIIIHTASIIEALLFYVLDNKLNEEEIADYYSRWELQNKSDLHTIKQGEEVVVGGTYKKISGDGSKEKLNLFQITRLLEDKGVCDSQLCKKIDKIRTLRNEQHLGTHKQVKFYTKTELEETFSVAKEIKDFVRDAKI